MAETKRCSKCGLIKDLEEFWKSPRNKGGLRTWCKTCFNQYDREIRSPRRRATEKYNAMHRAGQRRYIKNHPEVAKAHKVSRLIPLAPQCEECGTINAHLHKHHPDYSKPRQVVTLCVPCHEKVHHA